MSEKSMSRLVAVRDTIGYDAVNDLVAAHGLTEVVGTLFADTVERRLLCGEGCFDLDGLVALLREKGFHGPWGVEILSASLRALPVPEAVKLAAKSALTVL